jgi:hypothetical protein
MNLMVVMAIVFAALLVAMACVISKPRRARRKGSDEDAAREIYNRYVADVDALTQAYLLQGPSDDEWLARMLEPAGVPRQRHSAGPDPQRRAERTPSSRTSRRLSAGPGHPRPVLFSVGALPILGGIMAALLTHSALTTEKVIATAICLDVLIASLSSRRIGAAQAAEEENNDQR